MCPWLDWTDEGQFDLFVDGKGVLIGGRGVCCGRTSVSAGRLCWMPVGIGLPHMLRGMRSRSVAVFRRGKDF